MYTEEQLREIFKEISNGNIEVLKDHPVLCKNRAFMMKAVELNGRALGFVTDRLRDYKEVVMAAVSQDVELLKYASDELKNDREVVMAAVSQDGRLL